MAMLCFVVANFDPNRSWTKSVFCKDGQRRPESGEQQFSPSSKHSSALDTPVHLWSSELRTMTFICSFWHWHGLKLQGFKTHRWKGVHSVSGKPSLWDVVKFFNHHDEYDYIISIAITITIITTVLLLLLLLYPITNIKMIIIVCSIMSLSIIMYLVFSTVVSSLNIALGQT